MITEHLEAILKKFNTAVDEEGWDVLPEGTHLTLYAGRQGAPLVVGRIVALRREGALLYTRVAGGDLFILEQSDLFALGMEGKVGRSVRRAGFG
ncbi:hypothetical protein [Pajaroellobacter abortibovis]|uniref:Uncharacterized protein n=1 Tax=Pajaroellobacter abortibovis TaxID=1882918 RepID=A0A1L6MYA5_9BACT|nr:hypothetical protein [Pajaroellobacter abortibovis]APS00385.1 hypothetical protein BCY86_06615 [Pajaroellobacter abortibovis]